MKIFNTEDNQVTKIIHDDGSETAIKSVPSGSYNEELKEEYLDRSKYTVFISSSVGCPMKCSFCHLTIKGCSYKKLSKDEVVNNLKEAIEYKLKLNPELSSCYIKLSWMGMGDALLDSKMIKEVSIEILDWVLENDYATGLDGVDLSTVYPEGVSTEWIEHFNTLNHSLRTYPRNPKHEPNRTPFRFFYSMHSIEDQEALMPKTKRAKEVLNILIKEKMDFNIIFHRIFVEGENDGQEEITSFMNIIAHFGHELRILRYNSCDKSPYKESSKIKKIIKELIVIHNNIKVQVSPGSEVKAACGQFIVDAEVEDA